MCAPGHRAVGMGSSRSEQDLWSICNLCQSEAPDPRRASWRGHGPVNEAPGCDSHSHSACVIQVCPHRSSWAPTGPGLYCCSVSQCPWFSISTHGWPVQPREIGPADGGWYMLELLPHVWNFTVRGKKRGPVEPQVCILTLASVACVIVAGKTYLSL